MNCVRGQPDNNPVMTQIHIKVEPDADTISIDASSHIVQASLTEKAENGRANTQLLKIIRERTGEKASIVKGHRSRRKKIRTELPEKAFREKIEG